jgi:hypothetical protein
MMDDWMFPPLVQFCSLCGSSSVTRRVGVSFGMYGDDYALCEKCATENSAAYVLDRLYYGPSPEEYDGEIIGKSNG